jgi:hypothetical protein
MKTIYLRLKKSGNFEFSTKKEATHKFKSLKEFRLWFENKRENYNQTSAMWFGKLIKATYSQVQTYFNNFEEVAKYLKKQNN